MEMNTETHSYEELILKRTKKVLRETLKDKNADSLEKKAAFFYLARIQKMKPISDNQRFVKPEMGIGGTGDEEIRAPYVVRDLKTHQPLLQNGELIVIDCVFTSFETYMNIISSKKANCLHLIAGKGAYPVHEEDQRYVEKDPYAWAFEAMLDEYD